MSAPRAMIVEDEPRLREQLAERLATMWPELELCASVADGKQALDALHAQCPDILFLDIQLPGMSGLEVARRAGNKCHVVFITAYDEYAVAAFEQGAVDYVLKPFGTARLAATVARLKERIAGRPAGLEEVLLRLAATTRRDSYLRWVTASVGKIVKLVTIEEICYFRADNKYTSVVTAEAELLISKTIRELSEELDPEQFVQVHRSTLVNVSAIAAIDRSVRGRVTLTLKQRPESLSVSDAYATLFRQM